MQIRMFEFSEKYSILKIVSVILIVLWALYFILLYNDKSLFRNVYFRSILGLLVVAMIPTFFTGTLVYHQAISDVARRPLLFYALLIFVPLYYYPMNIEVAKKINLIIVVFGVLLAFFQSCFSFIPDIGKQVLADSAYITSRYGLVRMTVLSVMLPCVFYATFYLLVAFSLGKRRLLYLLGIVIQFYYIFFVFMSRSAIFAVLLSCILICFFYVPLRRPILLITISALLFCVLLELSNTKSPLSMVYDSVSSVVSETSNDDGNVGIRIDGIKYYWKEFQRTGYVGLGMVSRERMANTEVGIGMNEYSFNPADQGIFSVIIQFGFQGLILTGLICYRMMRDLKFVIKYSVSELTIITLAITVFLLYNIVSLSHIFLWHNQGIWWGLFFFLVWKLRVETEKNCPKKQRK